MKRSGVRGWAVRALVLSVVPVLIVSNPTHVQAAEGFTEVTAGASWDNMPGAAYGPGPTECWADISVLYVHGVSAQVSFNDVTCYGGFDVTPGFAQAGEAGSVARLWLTGTNCGGSVTATLGDHADNDTKTTAGYLFSESYTAGPDTCDPATACIEVTTTHDDTRRMQCVAVDIAPPGAPEPASQACQYGDVKRPVFTSSPEYRNVSPYSYQWRRDARWTVTGTGTASPGAWTVYAVSRSADGTYNWTGNSPSMSSSKSVPSESGEAFELGFSQGGLTVAPNAESVYEGVLNLSHSGGHDPNKQPGTVIGYGVIGQPTSEWAYIPTTANGRINGQIGITDPAKCAFYWGEKIAAIPNSTKDDPVGNVSSSTPAATPPAYDPPPPTPEEDGCTGFSMTDPASWATAGICALVGLVAKLIDVVTGIPGAILDGLRGLFVPVNAPSFSDLPSPLPEGWVPSMPALGGSSCGALSMPQLELGFQGWDVGPVTFANTCDAPWPLIRSFTYNGGLVMVLVSAVWMGYRIIASGLGMNVSMGTGGDDD